VREWLRWPRVENDRMNDEPISPESSLIDEAAQENERLVRAIVGGDREAEQAFAQRYLRRSRPCCWRARATRTWRRTCFRML